MALTKQQQTVIDTLQKPDVSLVLCPAVAGSGKTHTLVELAKQMPIQSGIYLAYNKSISDEAAIKFKGTPIQCLTIHAMAYRAVVKQYGLKVGYFGVRDIQSIDDRPLSYKAKKALVDTIEDFCLSAETDPNKYIMNTFANVSSTLFLHYLDKLANGEIQCSHSFYLKLYHIYLHNGTIVPPSIDLLMLDESADVTALTLEIFKLIKAPKKIAVGDEFQNIYSFNKTVNGFKELNDIGITSKLTESFRVSTKIAPRIEQFVRKHLDPKFEFKGHIYPTNFTITTKAYIARNNSGLLNEMFRLKEDSVPFNTTRPIDTILELPLLLANLGNGRPITEYKYKHIEKLRLSWDKSLLLQRKYDTVNKYVARMLSDDDEVQRALKVVYKHGPKDLNELATYVRGFSKTDTNLTLTTAHSSKGLEWHEVEIAPDLNETITKALVKIMDAKLSHNHRLVKEQEGELMLYYVAISRAMVKLTNAKYAKIL